MVLYMAAKACNKLSITKKDAIFQDIGANIGRYSLLFAATGHSVISLEPMQANERLFTRSICSNPDFQQRLTYHTDMLSDGPQQNCSMFLLKAIVAMVQSLVINTFIWHQATMFRRLA